MFAGFNAFSVRAEIYSTRRCWNVKFDLSFKFFKFKNFKTFRLDMDVTPKQIHLLGSCLLFFFYVLKKIKGCDVCKCDHIKSNLNRWQRIVGREFRLSLRIDFVVELLNLRQCMFDTVPTQCPSVWTHIPSCFPAVMTGPLTKVFSYSVCL